MSVAFIPYGQPNSHFSQLSRLLLDDVDWPLNDRPDGKCLADLTPQDHIVLIASSRMLTMRTSGLACPVSVLMGEPKAIQKRLYRSVRMVAFRFRYVITHSTELLIRLPNARFVAHGGTFLDSVDRPASEKTKRIGIIASSKRDTVGQRLRHELVEWASGDAPDLEALGLGYRPLENKADGHEPYLFSVVIENSQEAGYFTEKLIDSFLCHSLPVYWGAPDIEHFFDPRGMIACRTAQEARHAIRTLTADDYARRAEYLEANRLRALNYVDRFAQVARRLHDLSDGLAASEASASSARRAA